MVKELAIRNYWEHIGNFSHIVQDMGKSFSNMDKESLYNSIGFYAMDGYSAEDIFNLRKSCIQKGAEKTAKTIGLTADELLDFMEKSFGPIYSSDYLNHKSCDTRALELNKYVELLSTYILHDVFTSMNYGDANALIEQIKNHAKELKEDLISKPNTSHNFKDSLQYIFPNFQVVRGVSPFISEGVFYIPKKLSDKDKNFIYDLVTLNVIFGVSDISSDIFLNCYGDLNSMVFTDTLDYDSTRYVYITLVDLAFKKNTTVADIIERLGISHIKYWEQYRDHKCIFLARTPNDILVRCDLSDKVVSKELPAIKFIELYKKDLLYKYMGDGK